MNDLFQGCRISHGRLPRAKAGDPHISAERPAYATSTSATTNSSPVMGASALNEYVPPNVSPPSAIAASLSVLLFRPR
ncbi:hypothetical protein IG631_23598 [Alternaria alternata]|nr:hypothetical protein IG631_23598 [Alternaria alternata]